MTIKAEARIRRDALKPALTDPCYSAAGLRNAMDSDCLLPNLEWLVLLLSCSTAWICCFPQSDNEMSFSRMKCSCYKTKKRRPRFHITPADGLHNTDSHRSPTPSQLWSWCDYRYARRKFEGWARSFDGVTSRCEYSLPPVPPYSCSRFEEKQRLLPPLFQVVEDDKTLGSKRSKVFTSSRLVRRKSSSKHYWERHSPAGCHQELP